MLYRWISYAWLTFFTSTAFSAGGLLLLTENDPKHSMLSTKGVPIGYAVDIVNAIQHELGGKPIPISVEPWARIYSIALARPNTGVFTMGRTPEREDHFKWIGPIATNYWVFLARKEDNIKINSLDDAKKLPRIGSIREYAVTTYLEKNGFKNIEHLNYWKDGFSMQKLKRISVLAVNKDTYPLYLPSDEFDDSEYEKVFDIMPMPMYIAFSKNTDVILFEKWESAFQRIKKNGVMRQITQKWYPETN